MKIVELSYRRGDILRIEQLRYFLEVATSRSISTAAQNLFISQQALSTSLRKIEAELGLTLVVRSKTGIVLTEDGRLFAQYAIKM